MKHILFITLLIPFISFSQTPITDANFHQAIETCLSTNPVDGLCYDCEYGAMPDWDVSAVTNMEMAFIWFTSFNGDISNWDVSKVTNMNRMFYNSIFNQDISSWNVNNVTNMEFMFGSSVFNQDIGAWNVSNVTNMNNMFEDANVSNQNISSWDVGNVTTMYQMFYMVSSFNQDISSWNVSNVINMESMFASSVFNLDISSWDVSNVTNMWRMFASSAFNQDIGSWDVSNVTNMVAMFYNASSFNQDISNWCVEFIPTTPSSFSIGCPLLPEYHPLWGVQCVTGINNERVNDILAYPNPTESAITIDIESDKIKEINIYNQFSQKVFKITKIDGKIDLSDLSSGIYILEIKTDDGISRQKIVKK